MFYITCPKDRKNIVKCFVNVNLDFFDFFMNSKNLIKR
jgi:hypothetical protein